MSNEIEEIKQRIDIVELVGSYVQLKKAGANYKAPCPFHQEKTASLMVSPEKAIWKCFGCGRGGSVFDFVMESEHLEFADALKVLAQKAGVTLQTQTKSEYQGKEKKETLYRINRYVGRVFQTILLERNAGKEALSYLKKRKLATETIKEFSIGYAPQGFDLKKLLLTKGFTTAELTKAGSPDRFYNRIIFPIFDVLGQTIGFTGRILGDGEPKYLNSPETPLFNKSRVLYGLNLAKGHIKEKDFVVLVEGQMDVVALYQAGVRNVVASSGTAITETQLQILSKYTPNFLLAFDADASGEKATKKVIELLLKLDLNSKVINFGEFKDAGELFEKKPETWPDLAKQAEEGVEWWIAKEITSAGQMQFIENKKKVIKAMLPILALISDQTRLDHYAQRLAQAVGAKTESVYASLSRIKASTTSSENSAVVATVLTGEEQLLTLLMNAPKLAQTRDKLIKNIVWQSAEASTVAETLKKLYNDPTLVKSSPIQFISQVKNTLGPTFDGKIDSWQFWLSATWPELNDEMSEQLIDEKLGRLSTTAYEKQKEDLATNIKIAQQKSDIKEVKKLMVELSKLTAKQGEEK